MVRSPVSVATVAEEGKDRPLVMHMGQGGSPFNIVQVWYRPLHPPLCSPGLVMTNGCLLFEELSQIDLDKASMTAGEGANILLPCKIHRPRCRVAMSSLLGDSIRQLISGVLIVSADPFHHNRAFPGIHHMGKSRPYSCIGAPEPPPWERILPVLHETAVLFHHRLVIQSHHNILCWWCCDDRRQKS